jgi:hypothetical protein
MCRNSLPPDRPGPPGTAIVDLQASLSKTQSNLTALIVDYGASTQTTRCGDGISTSGSPQRVEKVSRQSSRVSPSIEKRHS